MQFRFITIASSHYVDKARWALDFSGVPYVEVSYCVAIWMVFAVQNAWSLISLMIGYSENPC
jgi:hypothetical protein